MKIVILDWKTMTSNNDLSYECFKKLGDVYCYDLTPNKLAIERINNAEIVLCNKTMITKEVIDKCPNIKYIGLFATGYNNVDIEYANSKNITVCNAGEYSTMAVAQHTFAMILSVFNKIEVYNNAVKNGEWNSSETFSYYPYTTNELFGKTLSIIGFGSIGKAVAKIGEAFGMNIIVNTRTIPESCKYTICDLDTAVSLADVLTIHCPLTPKTNKMINKALISKMKNTALLVNTSRGAVIDELDLFNALSNNAIKGACLDVLSVEPMTNDTPLKNAPNCIITPHTAWSAYETRQRLLDIVFENLNAFLDGNPINKVN